MDGSTVLGTHAGMAEVGAARRRRRQRVFVHERGAGPAVLLLHGFPTSAYDWRGVIDRLEDEYRCVAPDFIGYGLSDKPAAFSYSSVPAGGHAGGAGA